MLVEKYGGVVKISGIFGVSRVLFQAHSSPTDTMECRKSNLSLLTPKHCIIYL